MSLSALASNICKVMRNVNLRAITAYSTAHKDDFKIIDPPETLELCDNNYKPRHESFEQKKARLLYQSRKRGMLENDLLLATFAHEYLDKMNKQQIEEYDKVINLPSNDWDLFYWAIGKKPVPAEFQCSVMDMLKEHSKNTKGEKRYKQPALNSN